MAFSWCYQLVLSVLALATLFQQTSALTVVYCSTINTASTARNMSIYQSNGLCYDFCVSTYAFAVLQDNACWCSNYVPATTTTGCDTPCPGYPDDICGGSGVFGYLQLMLAPSGTEGASSSTVAAATTTAAQATSVVQQVTVTAIPQPVTIVETPTQATVQTSTSASSSSTTPVPTTTPDSSPDPSPTTTATPTVYTSLETITGQVRTITYAPSSVPTAGSSSGITEDSTAGGGDGLSTGGAVGLTVGLVALVIVIGSIAFFCWRKRKQEQEQATEGYNNLDKRGSTLGLASADGPAPPSRQMSQNSRFVLGTDGRNVVESWEEDENKPASRSSKLMPVDPRLNPFAPVYQRGENKSRESVNTIHDDHDYSRRVAYGNGGPLRAMNPDTTDLDD